MIWLGIFLGKAITGPLSVQIDLTNRCNNRCIACWCRSPLLKDKAMPRKLINKTLSFPKLKMLIEELAGMGVQEIYLTGGGEPFMHRDIIKIMELIKKNGMRCAMSTNFTLLDKIKIKRIVDLGVDEINVSLWAATPETYSKTHLNQTPETFTKIKENLKYIHSIKTELRRKKPEINLHNVIMKLNADEIKEMVEFAFEVKADSVDFVPVDTIPNRTDILLPSKTQYKKIINDIFQIKMQTEGLRKKFRHNLKIRNLDLFINRIKNIKSCAKYDSGVVDRIPCYSGWTFARIMADGNVIPCLKAHRIPSGNILNRNFSEIWYGQKEVFFRKKTFVYKKEGAFFTKIGNDLSTDSGCRKGCDNIEMNAAIHKFMGPFLFFKRRI